jgi:hypothetical protein
VHLSEEIGRQGIGHRNLRVEYVVLASRQLDCGEPLQCRADDNLLQEFGADEISEYQSGNATLGLVGHPDGELWSGLEL